MGEGAEQLRQDIEVTREEISRDVDALTAKVSPGRVMGDRVRRAREGLTSVKEKVMGRADELRESAGERTSSVTDKASDQVHGAQEKARAVSGQVSERVSGAAAGAKEAARTARDKAEGNPLAVGLIAFGVGWLAASLIPASEAETRAAARAQEVARDRGQPVMEKARGVASEVAADLKETARDAAQSVGDSARQGAQQVKEEGTGAAQSVRDTATNR